MFCTLTCDSSWFISLFSPINQLEIIVEFATKMADNAVTALGNCAIKNLIKKLAKNGNFRQFLIRFFAVRHLECDVSSYLASFHRRAKF